MLWPFLLLLIKPLKNLFDKYFGSKEQVDGQKEVSTEAKQTVSAEDESSADACTSSSPSSPSKQEVGLVKLEDEDDWPLLQNKQITFVLFCASWCHPCKKLKPFVEANLATEHRVEYVDVDEFQEIAVEAGALALPTFQAWSEGKLLGTVQGNRPESVKALFDEHRG